MDCYLTIGRALFDNKLMLSKKEIKKSLQEHGVTSIALQFVDINGKMKSLNLPVSEIDEILSNNLTFDGSSISGFRENETLDLVFYPDLDTFLIFPENIKPLKHCARFICDIYNSDGTPFEGCPRSNLKKLIKKMYELYEYSMDIGPEVEFFLFKTDKNNNIINNLSDSVGYYDLNSDENLEEVLNQMINALSKMGFKVDAIHHEGAPLQHEVDLGYTDILKAADNFITFKYTAKTIASMFGLKASFMPKPLFGINGSGLHLNISLSRNGKNAYFDENRIYQLSEAAMYSVGSLLKNINGITAVLNPTVNSYKRLVKDYEAPVYLAWSVINRSALIRIPAKRGNSTRLELRSPDGALNPYLAFAVILQTCIDGIRNKIDPPKPIEKNLFQLSSNEIRMRKIKSLPRNMYTALESFEKSLLAKAALGEYIFDAFLNTKRREWKHYRKQVTPWELKNYLDI